MKVATTTLALVILGLATQFSSSTAILPNSSPASANRQNSHFVKQSAVLQRRRFSFGKKSSATKKASTSQPSAEKHSSGTKNMVKEATLNAGIGVGVTAAVGAAAGP